MTPSDIKASMRGIYDDLIDEADGVVWIDLVDEFKTAHPDDLAVMGAEMVDDFLRRIANDTLSAGDRAASRQEQIPGLELPATVTIPDGEGGFRRKRMTFASVDDINADVDVHRQNYAAAGVGLQLSIRAQETLIPVMEAQGFKTAGKAMLWIANGTKDET